MSEIIKEIKKDLNYIKDGIESLSHFDDWPVCQEIYYAIKRVLENIEKLEISIK